MTRLLLLFVVLATGASVRAEVPAEALALQKTIHRVIETAEPSIACILVSRSGKYADLEEGPPSAATGKLGGFSVQRHLRFNDGPRREMIKRLDLAHPDTVPESYGSGVVIDPAGLILTNYHVIDKATKIYVRLPGLPRGSYADIVAGDARADLAVLKMLNPPAGLKTIKFGDGGMVRKGDWVVSLANPFAAGFRDGSPSASWGIISNVRRRAPGPTDEVKRVKPLAQYGTLLQTDARLNFGCSGGAIMNLEGELIGLTTSLAAIVGGETAGGYAMPMDNNFKKMIEVLKRGEEIEYGFLGVSVDPDERSDGRGVIVRDVSAGSPAAKAGLRGGDVITGINGYAVRDNDDLFLNIGAALAGTEADIEYRPGGVREARTIKARLVKATHGEAMIVSQRPKTVHGLRVEYPQAGAIDNPAVEGVLIKELEPNSPADRKLKMWFDKARLLVIAVNGKQVLTPADFYREAGTGAVRLDIIELGTNPDNTRQRVTLP